MSNFYSQNEVLKERRYKKPLTENSWDFIHPNDILSKFKNTYTQKYHEKPTVLAAYTYDSMSIILKSMEKTGILNTNSIFSIDYTGVTGAYLKNHQFYRSSNYVILSVNNDGYAYE